MKEADAAGFCYVTSYVDSTTRAGYFPGAKPIRVKLLAEKRTGRLLGAQVVGREDGGDRLLGGRQLYRGDGAVARGRGHPAVQHRRQRRFVKLQHEFRAGHPPARFGQVLAQAFGERFVPVLVPPWNRVGDALLPHLPAAGFAGLSCFGPRPSRDAAPGLAQVNAHVDPIAWRRHRAFIGADAALERIVAHLAARRAHACDADEPTGLLTHHLAFTGAAFDFVDDLLRHTRPRRAAVWLDAAHAFALRPEALICCR